MMVVVRELLQATSGCWGCEMNSLDTAPFFPALNHLRDVLLVFSAPLRSSAMPAVSMYSCKR